jgi:hypothetical protein
MNDPSSRHTSIHTPYAVTKMFGSLVILFPTSFDGGGLIMRKEEKKSGHLTTPELLPDAKVLA